MKIYATPVLTVLLLASLFSHKEAQAIVSSTYVFQQAKNMDAFWDFNGSNPLLDKTGNGFNLTNSGATFIAPTASGNGWVPNQLSGANVAGEVSRVANFNGGAFLDIPNSVYSGGSFTWIGAQRRTGGAFQTLLASSRFRYQNVFQTLQGAINSPGGSFGSSSPLVDNDWYLIALTYDNGSKALNSYAVTNSGVFGGPVLTGSAAGIGLSNAINFRMGLDNVSFIGGGDGFTGQMDFAAWKNAVLTAGQLQGILNDFVNGPTLVTIPEPSSLMIWGMAGLCTMAYRRRSRGQQRTAARHSA
jgi:hypothetical protein